MPPPQINSYIMAFSPVIMDKASEQGNDLRLSGTAKFPCRPLPPPPHDRDVKCVEHSRSRRKNDSLFAMTQRERAEFR